MIKVFSTYTKDKIYKNNKLLTLQNGGPALFFEKVLKDCKTNQKLNVGKLITINIKLIKNGEIGTIEGEVIKKMIDDNRKNDVVIVSTISDEWMLPNKESKSKAFLDVQGYVRAAQKDRGIYQAAFWKNIFCLKGTQAEIAKLPRRIINDQKQRLLIITKGEKGCVIYSQGERFNFFGKKIQSTNTIGAGDTFFINFIIKFLKTKDVKKSGEFAISETEKFLLNK